MAQTWLKKISNALYARGTDANIDLELRPKGTGKVNVTGGTGGVTVASGGVTVTAGNLTVTDPVVYSDTCLHSAAKTQTKAVDYTMTAADSGMITYVNTDAKTITLPATVVGMVFTLVNAGADGAVALKIAPDANDKIQGCGLTAADNKYIINTKATAKHGDRVTLIGDGVDGWFIADMAGTWARE